MRRTIVAILLALSLAGCYGGYAPYRDFAAERCEKEGIVQCEADGGDAGDPAGQ